MIGSAYVLALAHAVQVVFIDQAGLDRVDFMVRVPVCMIFGIFLLNNMMQGSLLAGVAQPIRGLILLPLAAMAAFGMYALYAYASTLHTGAALASGPEGGFALEIWIASAMLGVTFPVIIMVSGFFEFWPIRRT